MKLCRLCRVEKTSDEFQKHRAVCKSCRKVQQQEWRKPQQERLNQKQREWKKQNPEKARQTNLKWVQANPELEKQIRKNWINKNRELLRAQCNTRRRKVKQHTPAWADIKRITEIYLNCPEGYHVDHIIPLRGKNVSGLHVESNLQYLPATENIKKGNKFDNSDSNS